MRLTIAGTNRPCETVATAQHVCCGAETQTRRAQELCRASGLRSIVVSQDVDLDPARARLRGLPQEDADRAELARADGAALVALGGLALEHLHLASAGRARPFEQIRRDPPLEERHRHHGDDDDQQLKADEEVEEPTQRAREEEPKEDRRPKQAIEVEAGSA